MLLIVFGAGASHDAVHDSVEQLQEVARLPLTDALFEHGYTSSSILEELPQAIDIVQTMREAVASGIGVEAKLSELAARATVSTDIPRVRRDLAAVRFFIQRMIGKRSAATTALAMNNQRSLLRQVDDAREPTERVALVTFNYDLLIEEACRSLFGLEWDDIGAYVDPRPYPLFKLHGSINWWRETGIVISSAQRNVVDWLVKNADDVHLTDWIVVGDSQAVSGQPIDGQVRLRMPALAVPATAKLTFECPQQHVTELVELVRNVDRVLFVGWRTQEDTFLALLHDHLPGHVVGEVLTSQPDTAQQLRERLEHEVGIKEWVNVDRILGVRSFSRYVAEGHLQSLLDATPGLRWNPAPAHRP